MKKKSSKKKASSKYTIAADDSEPGSKGTVLKNKLGIKSIRKMNDLEIQEYVKAASSLVEHFKIDHSFGYNDIRFIHKEIFGKLYDWAGEYRNVDMSKDEFVFARAIFIPQLMKEFSTTILEAFTPPHNLTQSELALLLAKIHVEFIIIHPFREGNGRIIRLLLSLIALQADYAGLNFFFIKSKGKEYDKYIAAIHAGIKDDYSPLAAIIERALFR